MTYKNTSFASLTKQIIVLLVITCLWTTYGCTEKPAAREIQYLDTLAVKIAGNGKALNIDTDELVSRKNLISKSWMLHANDTTAEVRDKLRDDLKGMLSAYDLFLNNYILLVSANELHLAELKALKEATLAGECPRQEFKERYALLAQEINATEKDLARIAQPVYDLEPMYKRLAIRWGVRF